MSVLQAWDGADSGTVLNVLLVYISIMAVYFVIRKLIYIGRAMKAKSGRPKGS